MAAKKEWLVFYCIAGSQSRRFLTQEDRYNIVDIGEAYVERALRFTEHGARAAVVRLTQTTLEKWQTELEPRL